MPENVCGEGQHSPLLSHTSTTGVAMLESHGAKNINGRYDMKFSAHSQYIYVQIHTHTQIPTHLMKLRNVNSGM